MIAPHTLSNFQSLTKLIPLIINHFYSHCRSDWQIVLTKQNFSDSLCKGIISFLYFVAKLRIKSKTTKNNAPHPPLSQACSLCPIQNSEFIIPFAARTLTHPITPIAPIIARVAHTPLFPSLPTNSTTAAFSPFERGVGGNVTLFPSPSHNSKFTICQFPSHYLEHFIGLKNSFLYGG